MVRIMSSMRMRKRMRIMNEYLTEDSGMTETA